MEVPRAPKTIYNNYFKFYIHVVYFNKTPIFLPIMCYELTKPNIKHLF